MADEAITAEDRAELDALRAARAEKAAADAKAEADAAEAEAKRAAAVAEAERADQEAAAARKASPHRFVGLDSSELGTYIYVEAPGNAFLREFHLGGVPYHHVAEDGDGVWLYRRGA